MGTATPTPPPAGSDPGMTRMTGELPLTGSVGRQIAAGLLILAGAILTVASVLAIWLNTVVFDTPTWKATSQQLIESPVIQKEVTAYLVDEIYNSAKVRSQIDNALPPALKSFSPEVISGMRQVSQAGGERLMQRPRVQTLWVDASVRAHDEVVKLIENKGTYVKTNGGTVVLDLHSVLEDFAASAGLSTQAAKYLPPDAGKLTILESSQLETTQAVARVLHALALWLPLVTVALFALAIWVARGFRRRALLWTAIGILLATIVLIFVRRALGSMIIDALVSNVAVRPALLTAWYIGTEVLGTINWTLFIVALILVAGLWVSSPGALATRLRTRMARWIANPYYAFGVPAGLLVILIAWGPLPAFRKLVPVIIIAAIAAAGIEALRRQVIAERGGPGPDR